MISHQNNDTGGDFVDYPRYHIDLPEYEENIINARGIQIHTHCSINTWCQLYFYNAPYIFWLVTSLLHVTVSVLTSISANELLLVITGMHIPCFALFAIIRVTEL